MDEEHGRLSKVTPSLDKNLGSRFQFQEQTREVHDFDQILETEEPISHIGSNYMRRP